MARRDERRQFGEISRLPSGRFRARYADPEGRTHANGVRVRHTAPTTFESRADAEAWLVDERRIVSSGEWSPPGVRAAVQRTPGLMLGEYAPRWLANRRVKGQPLADRTRDHYQDLLDRFILPFFGQVRWGGVRG